MTGPILHPGDKVALVCASSTVPEERLDASVAAVEALGLRPVVYPTCYHANRHGNFAATDAQRARDLEDAFLDDSIQGVLSIRGGYGAGRLLSMLNWAKILQKPKFFSGYSDVTALHIPLNNAGWVTYHTIMPSTEYYKEVDDFSLSALKAALFGGLTGVLPMRWDQGGETAYPGRSAGGATAYPGRSEGCETVCPGWAEGPLVGGNLSLVVASLGTPWEIDTCGKILFLEDVDEEPYRIDGMLTHLKNAGKLDDCAGVALGYWTDCVPKDDKPTLSLDEVLEEILVGLKKPVLKGLPCGHSLPSMALPLGANVRLDATNHTLEVLP